MKRKKKKKKMMKEKYHINHIDCLICRFMELTCGANQQRRMSLYLKSRQVDGHNEYSVEQVNDLPTVAECLVS